MDNFNSKMDKKINDFVLKNHLTPDENKFSAITDGLVNPKTYFASKYKILWILKEPYDEIEISEEGGIPCGGGWSAAGNLANYDKISENYANKTYNRIANTTYCILNNLKRFESKISEEDAYKMFLSIGIMNVSKMPNLTLSDNSYIQKQYEIWKPILLEQIQLYNPDILIFGNTFSCFRKDIFTNEEISKQQVIKQRAFLRNKKLYLNWYHPCYFLMSDSDYINPLLDDINSNLL